MEGGLDRLRVDNIGSMLRPRELRDAVDRHQRGEVGETELRAVQERAIRHLVAAQEAHGWPVIVDGEFRRLQFMESFRDVAGFEQWATRHQAVRAGRPLPAGDGGRTEAPSAVALTPATERLWLRHNRPLEEFRFAQSLTARPVKTTLIGPDRIFQAHDRDGSHAVYPDPASFLADVVAVERRMVSELVAAGCRYVHLDAPGFTAYVDPASLDRLRARGLDPAETMTRTIEAENAVVAGFPEVTFGIHLCRGNERSHWHREGAYDAIAEQLFGELRHQRLLLEYDTPRAGGFEPLRYVPRGKTVVLGLVTTKAGRLETVDELRRRIEEAARYVPVEQLALSPQCGFASSLEGNDLTEAEQWAKLDVVLETAQAVWG